MNIFWKDGNGAYVPAELEDAFRLVHPDWERVTPHNFLYSSAIMVAGSNIASLVDGNIVITHME